MPRTVESLQQNPAPGNHGIHNCGDLLEFTLVVPESLGAGRGWLRTNLGNAGIRRREIIEHTERCEPILERDWHDLPMIRGGGGVWRVGVPLVEVGRFEGKCYFLRDDDADVLWPEGANAVIKVEPADQVAGNTLYSAFVRQFRQGREDVQGVLAPEEAEAVGRLEDRGCTVIPASGTFRQMVRELDLILNRMNFRILQLLPIHPIPTTYARMGRFGSPFAALDLMDVDPALAEFDRRSTPMDQFIELVDAVHARGARLFLDMPVNHTGWASRLQVHHPEWFKRRDDTHEFRSPGAWGVTWEDLSELDFRFQGLREYMAAVMLFWCARGVDGFRCDAGYMVPVDVWRYLVARVRQEYPDTTFLLEGLGGKISTTRALLDEANLDWAYSELFQNYDRSQIENYLPGALDLSERFGTLIHFAETHDNLRLAASGGRAYAKMRCALTALCSHVGAFGITNGVEWFAEAKVDVHEASPMRWGAADNQVDFIARLTWLLSNHPAFARGVSLRMIQSGGANAVAVLREHPTDAECNLLVVANLDCESAARVEWSAEVLRSSQRGDGVYDWVSGDRLSVHHDHGVARLELPPAGVVCLACSDREFSMPRDGVEIKTPDLIRRQELRAMALRLKLFFSVESIDGKCPGRAECHPDGPLCVALGLDDDLVDAWASGLGQDPEAACARIAERPVPLACMTWNWPRDLRRVVPMARGQALLVRAPHPFMCRLLLSEDERCVQRVRGYRTNGGEWVAFLCPPRDEDGGLTLESVVYTPGESTRGRSRLCVGDHSRFDARVRVHVERGDPLLRESWAVCVNGRGGYALVRADWGEVRSQYDALLAANPHPGVPVDRSVLFTRCRVWVVNRGYSQELNIDSLLCFERAADGSVQWHFDVPVGMGRTIPLHVRLELLKGENRVRLAFERGRSDEDRVEHCLDDDRPVGIILRPDVENRSCHEKTKAYLGPETGFPRAVRETNGGFVFAPHGENGDAVGLEMRIDRGDFVREDEWLYMVDHPFERQRGLDDATDLFSPGYFRVDLKGGECVALSAGTNADRSDRSDRSEVGAVLRQAICDFVVRRDEHSTVIAGYPWFLDWGRDTLICLRGIVAAGLLDEAEDILVQFAKFEKGGTIPNMIRGEDDTNRDTSDAPLWLFVAARDLWLRRPEILGRDCGGRSLRQVLIDLAGHLFAGTDNGIRVDQGSGLVFSPSHFTWMDTNYPAGTPRQGYPVEVQALWFAALSFLDEIDSEDARWREGLELVRESIRTLYRLENGRGLSDCLHCEPGQSAVEAEADDALRPNQLLAVTLGAVDDPELAGEILGACRELLIPGGIRSLADQRVRPPLRVEWNGRVLNAPENPYWGRYEGDEDTRRKPAYHNGTAWTWPFPSYAEALFRVYGEVARKSALDVLATSEVVLNAECLGHVCEVLDGDAPHAQRGCGAQAWGATELYRVLALLND